MSDGKVVANNGNNVKSAMCHSAAINLSENYTTVVFPQPTIRRNNTLNIDEPTEPKIDNSTAILV